MRTFVIFSDDELVDMLHGEPVEDETNHIAYISEDGYKRYREKQGSDDQWD